jgi:hypothetical protein
VRTLNDAVAFLLELGALAALAFRGASVDAGILTRVGLAIAAPALAATVWGLFAAPRAKITVPLAGQLAVKALVFGAAVAALAAAGAPTLAAIFAALVMVNTAVVTMYRRSEPGFASQQRPAP